MLAYRAAPAGTGADYSLIYYVLYTDRAGSSIPVKMFFSWNKNFYFYISFVILKQTPFLSGATRVTGRTDTVNNTIKTDDRKKPS